MTPPEKKYLSVLKNMQITSLKQLMLVKMALTASEMFFHSLYESKFAHFIMLNNNNSQTKRLSIPLI